MTRTNLQPGPERDARDRAIAAAYTAGATTVSLGQRYGMSSTHVGVILKSLGIELRPRGTRPGGGRRRRAETQRTPAPVVTKNAPVRYTEIRLCALCSNDAVSGEQVCSHHLTIIEQIAANDANRRQRRAVPA